jgi:hypothetical protein
MKDPNVIVRSVLLNVHGFVPSVSAHKTGKLASFSTKIAEVEELKDENETASKKSIGEQSSVRDEKSEAKSIKGRDPLESHESDWEDEEGSHDDSGADDFNSPAHSPGADAEDKAEDARERDEVSEGRSEAKAHLLVEEIVAPVLSQEFNGLEYPNRRGFAGKYKGGSFWKGSRTHSMEDWRSSVFESISFVDNAVAANPQLHNDRNSHEGSIHGLEAKESYFSALAGQVSLSDPLGFSPSNQFVSIESEGMGQEFENGSRDPEKDEETLGSEEHPEAADDDSSLPPANASACLMNDDVILDGKAIMMKLGRVIERHVHSLNLRSAYECYSSGGEPLYTESVPLNAGGSGVLCSDFIFYSQSNLVASRLLSIPSLTQLRCDDPRQPTITIDSMWRQVPPSLAPHFCRNHQLGVPIEKLMNQKRESDLSRAATVNSIKASVKSMLGAQSGCLYGGNWAQFATYNPERTWSWLPNDQFGSSHLAIGCEFFIYDEVATVQWT